MQNRITVTGITFPSGSIILEGRLSLPQGGGQLPGVVLCHPHPLHGGDMDNNVLQGITEALEGSQMAVLAFNFRGVGRSQGTHDNGKGEVDDALAAARCLAGNPSVDRDRIVIVGYSFGAVVALRAAARDEGFQAVALVACPTRSLESPEVQAIRQPKLFIHGDMDNVVQMDQFNSIAQRFPQSTEIEVLPGADHFLQGYELQVGERVADFFASALG
ncbi:MAG: alpha/beta fold hydrolase [Dehalococcoidia bacterium]|nr:alpha/beta fold hydrolase [Dehalococcoidia bacterium]